MELITLGFLSKYKINMLKGLIMAEIKDNISRVHSFIPKNQVAPHPHSLPLSTVYFWHHTCVILSEDYLNFFFISYYQNFKNIKCNNIIFIEFKYLLYIKF